MGSGFKTFTAGSVLTAADVNNYLMKQSVIVCTSGTRPSSPEEGETIYETDTDTILVYNGSWRAQLDIATRQAIKGSDQNVNNSTTLVNDSALTLGYGVGTYRFEICSQYSAGTTADFKWALTFTNATVNFINVGLDTALAYLPAVFTGYTSGTANTQGGAGVGSPRAVHIIGNMVSTVAGTLTFQFAQNVAVVENCTSRSGSHMILTRLA